MYSKTNFIFSNLIRGYFVASRKKKQNAIHFVKPLISSNQLRSEITGELTGKPISKYQRSALWVLFILLFADERKELNIEQCDHIRHYLIDYYSMYGK